MELVLILADQFKPGLLTIFTNSLHLTMFVAKPYVCAVHRHCVTPALIRYTMRRSIDVTVIYGHDTSAMLWGNVGIH